MMKNKAMAMTTQIDEIKSILCFIGALQRIFSIRCSKPRTAKRFQANVPDRGQIGAEVLESFYRGGVTIPDDIVDRC